MQKQQTCGRFSVFTFVVKPVSFFMLNSMSFLFVCGMLNQSDESHGVIKPTNQKLSTFEGDFKLRNFFDIYSFEAAPLESGMKSSKNRYYMGPLKQKMCGHFYFNAVKVD